MLLSDPGILSSTMSQSLDYSNPPARYPARELGDVTRTNLSLHKEDTLSTLVGGGVCVGGGTDPTQ